MKIRIGVVYRRGLLAMMLVAGLMAGAAWVSTQAQQDASPFKGLGYRNIGPFRGGRVTAVAGVTSQPNVYYFGATGGGVYKTTDGGVNWAPVSDGFFKTGSVGAIGVSESDPNVVYVGMGEVPIRGNVSHGDGMYKSTDAGKTWKKIGLDDTRHIGRVRVHPRNPDVVYVAALGHIFGPNDERGVFRTTDGGRTWKKVLFRGNKAGAVDLILDPSNPDVIYAGFWEVYRTPYSLESGGPGSGILKSTDGGETWKEITRNPGLPRKMVGKIGITVSPADPNRLWAIVEAEDGGVFRTDNGGDTWTKVNEDRNLRQRAWYYTRIYADPKSVDTVYVLNTGFYKSGDGGRTYSTISVPHGDNHDLWIAPNDPLRMINSNDGGANVSFNGGETWSEQDQATAQFYRVALDNDFPYHVYGAQQDNSTVRILSRTSGFGITANDWQESAGAESGWLAPHPKDSNIVFGGNYGGYISRLDHRTGQNRNVTVWPDNPMGWGAEGMKFRFQWNFPLLFSPHDQNTLYAAGNMLFKTTNDGQSWQAISPDLTRNDRSKQGSSGGPITKDNTSVEYYCTIFTVSESPVQKGIIWTGSDDGLVHVTQNGGGKWDNVTPKDIPEWIQINSIEASPHAAGAAYFAGTMYKSDDFRPYLYKTTDFGRTWKKIVNGLPNDSFTRVIREDPHRRGLLYAGTETGMWISFDDGENWQSLQLNLPVVPITDLAIHKRDKDLVVATQGRSFWILDDLTILHQWKDAIADAHLFKPEESYRMAGGGGRLPANATIGENPPSGVTIWYHLKEKPKGDVEIEILDSTGKSIKKFSSKAPEGAEGGGPGGGRRFGGGAARVPAEKGFNRFAWDLRYSDAKTFPGMILWAGMTRGPKAVPGKYQVKLTVDGKTLNESFELRKDPRIETTQDDFQKQFDLLSKISAKLTETHEAIISIRDVRKQANDTATRVKDHPGGKAIADAARALSDKLTAIEEELYQTKNRSSQDPLNFPIKLNNKLAALAGSVDGSDDRPTDQSYQVYDDLAGRIDAQLAKLKAVMSSDVPAFNKLVRDKEVPAVFVK
ncbi:MAG: WD40/YVTN/BNR-like repeat-containing protein [Blastocatellales bacterium]